MTMNTREEILAEYLEHTSFGADYSHFDKVPLSKLKELTEAGLIDRDECQNDSPTTEEFMKLMKAHKGFTAHGYIIGGNRSDKRATIEGVEGIVSADKLPDVLATLRHADELTIINEGATNEFRVRAWWD